MIHIKKFLLVIMTFCLLIPMTECFTLSAEEDPREEPTVPSESIHPTEEVDIKGHMAYVNERGVILYFCFEAADVGKTIEVTVGSIVKKYTVTVNHHYGIGISLKTDQLNSKITIEYGGETLEEYTLKRYLNAALKVCDITAEQNNVVEALLNKEDYATLLPKKNEE